MDIREELPAMRATALRWVCGASEQAEGASSEAFGDVGVAFLLAACVEFFGGVFPVHYEFSSAHR
jgi:hypothetical protein